MAATTVSLVIPAKNEVENLPVLIPTETIASQWTISLSHGPWRETWVHRGGSRVSIRVSH